MLRAKDGDFFIADWLRNRNTVEFLGIWESVFNPDFNNGESAISQMRTLLPASSVDASNSINRPVGTGRENRPMSKPTLSKIPTPNP